MEINGADIFLKTLKIAGVEYIFGNPGTTEVGLLKAYYRSLSPKFILGLHETVVTGMADGYGRASGIPGVSCVHTTVGTANSLGMTINSFADHSPLVVVAGVKDSRISGGNVFCGAPFYAADLLHQYTRHAHQCLEPASISRDTAMALHQALAPPGGPTYLAVPENFWEAEVSAEVETLSSIDAPVADGDQLRKAAEMLLKAERPVLLAGNETGREEAIGMVMELAERIKAPVYSEENLSWSYLNFPNTHLLYCGPFDRESSLLKDADLLLGIGSKMFMASGFEERPHISRDMPVIQMHPDLSQLGFPYPVRIPLAGSIRKNLEILLNLLPGDSAGTVSGEDWQKSVRDYVEKRIGRLAKDRLTVSSQDLPTIFQLLECLSKNAAPDTIVVNEGIRSGFQLQDHFDFTPERSYFGYTGGCLGWGIPAAMGIKLARPQKEVIAFVGDGSMLFSPQALWTAARYNIGIKAVICNNDGYMAVKSRLKDFCPGDSPDGKKEGLIGEFGNPEIDFASLSRSFGVPALKVEREEQLPEMVRTFLEAAGPILLEVRLETSGL